MSRHGYTDECEDPLAQGRWLASLRSAIRGRRGQAMLRELAAALDAMPTKELYAGAFQRPTGECCALGVLGQARGIDMSHLEPDPEDDFGEHPADPALVAATFGIADVLAREVMFRNDDLVSDDEWIRVVITGPMRGYAVPRGCSSTWPEWHERSVLVPIPDAPARRWRTVRAWVAKQINEARDQHGITP